MNKFIPCYLLEGLVGFGHYTVYTHTRTQPLSPCFIPEVATLLTEPELLGYLFLSL